MTERTKRNREPFKRRTKQPDAEGFITGTTYSEKIAAEIANRLADGASWMSLANTGEFPAHRTLYIWRDRYPEFAAALRWAREAAADLKADKALAVAEKATSATVSSDRLHYQALMKRAALDAPERWDDRVRTPAKPIPVEVTFYARHFERVIGPDGKVSVREVKPEGRS